MVVRRIEFADYTSYVKAQRRTANRRKRWSYAKDYELKAIAEYLKQHAKPPYTGLCHGAHCGAEVMLFRNLLGEEKIWGTDLFPKLRDERGKSYAAPNGVEVPGVIKCDFSDFHERWSRRFAFVYSNSLDHARDAETCLQVWLDQLRDGGLLFIQWSRSHATVQSGDCFGGGLDDYLWMLNHYGKVVELLFHNVKSPTITFAVSRRPKKLKGSWKVPY